MADGAVDLFQKLPSASAPLEELERDCLETAREAIRSPRLYPSLTGTTRQIANDYRNRALFELVQNAHDALSGEGQDEIRIVYRRMKDSAVLMVANRGTGFDADNVEGVRLPSRSTKTYGEGIGNKGLGLRSLASLTQSPEIYSCLG